MELMPTDLSQYMRCCNLLSDGLEKDLGSKRRPPVLKVDAAIDVMLQLCKAVLYLHNNSIAHRDLKPSNVLVRAIIKDEVPELSARGYLRVKLSDFGLAKLSATSSAYSTQTKQVGTKLYGAPEVFDTERFDVKKFPLKADVWSFGITCCEILKGEPAFDFNNSQELQVRIRKGLRPQLPTNCPTNLKFIIRSCWQFRPENRPDFSDLLRLLRLAQARSLGLMQEDHDLFNYKTREFPFQRRLASNIQSQLPSTLPRLLSFSSLKMRNAFQFFTGKWYLHIFFILLQYVFGLIWSQS